MSQKPETVPCPGCGLELPEDDFRGQVEHMQARHPDIVGERLTDAGFRQEGGKWVDPLATDD